MSENPKNLVGFCGLYCGACGIYQGKIKEAVRLLYIFMIELIREKGIIRKDENLTGREIVKRLNKKFPEIDRANVLFEIASYSSHQIPQHEAKWMVNFVVKSESDISRI